MKLYELALQKAWASSQEVWPLGAVAELKVPDPKVLSNPILHRVPTKMMVERMKMERRMEVE